MANSEKFRILCVCTANICRSPVAERLLSARLGPDVTVSSAGTFGLEGSPIAPPMARRLHEIGIRADDFAARRVTVTTLLAADLILTMTRKQRSEVVGLAPATVRRVFTLPEFARLLSQLRLDDLPSGSLPERLAAAVRAVGARRSPGTTDDIDDPYGRSEADYTRAFAEIESAAAAFAALDPAC